MSKGDNRRPTSPHVDDAEVTERYEALFGKTKLNIMPEDEAAELRAETERLAEEETHAD